MLAAEASAAQHLIVDAGAIDMLLYELRRKFAWVVVDLPRGANPMQRVVLGAASHVVVVCERSLAGLRDTIRLQTLMREQAPQVRLWLVEAGATGDRALIGKSEFEKGIGKSLDASLSYDPKSAGAAANSGQPLPVAAPRSPVVREFRQLAELLAGPATPVAKRKLVCSAMVGRFKRSESRGRARRPHRRLSARRASVRSRRLPLAAAGARGRRSRLRARCRSRTACSRQRSS